MLFLDKRIIWKNVKPVVFAAHDNAQSYYDALFLLANERFKKFSLFHYLYTILKPNLRMI